MDTREAEYKEKIRANLNNVLTSGFVPELGEHRKGKRSDVHFKGDKVIMIASDRISCFDHVLSRCVPFKGRVLNLFSEDGMSSSADIIPNTLLPSPDVNVVIQRRLKNSGFECVVRGYMWGSLAAEYEAGKRSKCGLEFREGLHRYGCLDDVAFTPTTKAEKGHDLDVSLAEIAKVHGDRIATALRANSVALFRRAQARARKAGMLFIDTKYEFFFDEEGNMYVGDEVNTPDSSRLADNTEYEAKFKLIVKEMASGRWRNVSELLKDKPELKIKEASKQFVRDVLIEAGYKEGMPIPDLTDEQVVETAWRYIDSYEKLTGKRFDFGDNVSPRRRIMRNLVDAGLAYGACVVPIGASEKDSEHWGKLETGLKEAGVPFVKPIYLSAHKQTRQVLDKVVEMDATSIEPLVYLTFAGRSNGLGPVVAGNTNYPVITCPVFSDTATYAVDIHSSLRMPSKLPLATIVDPGNAALFAKRVADMTR